MEKTDIYTSFSNIVFITRSLKVKINALGHDHSVVAVTYMNLGTLEMYRENSAKSLGYNREAADILEVIDYCF